MGESISVASGEWVQASSVEEHGSTGAGTLALQWLESVRTALVVVDRELEVHWANSLAQKSLLSKDPLSAQGSRLHLGRSQQQLRSLLCRADNDVDGICLPMEGGGANLVVFARRITGPNERPFYGLIIRQSDALETRLLGVDEAFGLTGSEARVLRLLMKGQTAQPIAAELKVSVETVRTHIRGLYAKLGVGSREAMFMRLRPFMLSN